MKLFRSMRWRLLLWYGLLLVFILSGLALTAFHFEKTRLIREIDGKLQRRVGILAGSLRRPKGPRDAAGEKTLGLRPEDAALFGPAEGFYYAVWLHNGAPLTLSENAPGDIPMPASSSTAIRTRDHRREAFLLPAPGDCVLAGCSLKETEETLLHFSWLLAGGGAAILAIGLLGGWLLVTKALQPTQAITLAATKIAHGDLTQRINVTETESELGELATILNDTFTRLDAAFAQQARFTADAAHELRTPITVILTHVQESLTSDDLSPDNRESLEACQRAAQRMRRLVESLLQLARFEAGQESIRHEPCDLAHICEESLKLLQPIAEKRGIIFATQCAAASCVGDGDRLGQVVTNLLSNALHHSRDGSKIHITTGRENGTAFCRIEDEGTGIPPEHLPHIFERFYRADKARSTHHGKTGLGLAISKAIMEAHKGTITATSIAGQGATFVIHLPAR